MISFLHPAGNYRGVVMKMLVATFDEIRRGAHIATRCFA